MQKNVIAQFNKYPFFLFLTYFKKARLDLEKNEISTDLNHSRLDPVPVWQVALMKYMPILFLLYWSNYPNSKNEFIVMCISITVFCILALFWQINIKIAKILFLTTVFLVYFLHFKFGVSAIYIHWFLGYLLTSLLPFYIGYDVYNKQYENYYYLLGINSTKRIQIATRKKRPLIMIPFLSKFTKDKREGILYVTQGFNLGFNVFLKGYYVRIVKELKDETNEAE